MATITLSLDEELAAQMDEKIRRVDTDRSKYIRSLVRADLAVNPAFPAHASMLRRKQPAARKPAKA